MLSIPVIGIARPDAQMKPISQRIFFLHYERNNYTVSGVKVSFSQLNING